MSLDDKKLRYLHKKYTIDIIPKHYEIKTNCELCNRELITNFIISKNLRPYNFSSQGMFHNDEDGDIHLYCSSCGYKIRELSASLAWFYSLGKEIQDLNGIPKFRKLRRQHTSHV